MAAVLSVVGFHQVALADVPTPESILGFKVGDDFKLASYDQSIEYFKALAAASDRVELRKVGKTSEGRDCYIALISNPENLANVERYREISQRLAHPEGLTDEDARALAAEGKTIVSIDGGLHATETAHAQHTIQLAYDLVSEKDGNVAREILENVILILWPSINPDGQNMVVEWYNKNLGTPWETSGPPQLYQKYVGHDNNRDGYGINMIESRIAVRTKRYWEPQVMYSHHMTASSPSTIWLPPYSEPIDPNVHPLMTRMVNLMGTAAAAALDAKGLMGAEHGGETYDAWYPGYIDFINFPQNIVVMFSETGIHGSPTPQYIRVRQVRPGTLMASQWPGGWWRLKDSVDYMLVASTSTLEISAKFREQILYNRYQAGRDTIAQYRNGPPYAYFIPQDQRDPVAAVEMLRRVAFQSINVHQLTKAMEVEGQHYEAGTWVIKMDQPNAGFAQTLLEVQDYPNLLQYSGGPPDLPYDQAGWTLPYQFGVRTVAAGAPLEDDLLAALKPVKGKASDWDRVNPVEKEVDAAPFDSVPGVGFNTNAVAAGIVPPKGKITGNGTALALDPAQNNSFRAINKALAKGARVSFVPKNDTEEARYLVTGLDKQTIDTMVSDLALAASRTSAKGVPVKNSRIAMYRPLSPSMDEGWTRWLLEMYDFDFTSLYPADVKSGNLVDRYDVIVLVDIRGRGIINGAGKGSRPPRYTGGIGAEGLRALDAFVREGGTLVTMNSSSLFAIENLHLPVKNVVADVKRQDFYPSGSIFEVIVNQDHPVMAGMPERAAVNIIDGPVFSVEDDFKGRALAKFDTTGSPLMSGFLIGEKYMQGYAAALDVEHGDGNVILMNFRPQWRGQPFGTFRVLFNSLFYSGAITDYDEESDVFWEAPDKEKDADKDNKEAKKEA